MASLTPESFAATQITEESPEIGGTDVSTKRPIIQRDTFLGEFPYVRFGSGRENLVILPGITLENEPPNRLAAWTYRLGFGRFARAYTVYVINRRRGMPPGYTTQDMAQDYARVIEGELGTSHVMGFSTGGSIAQYVALDRPEVVRSLLLIVSACRLSKEGRETCERWQALTRRGRWQELRADMAWVTVTSETNKRLARAFMRFFGRFVIGTPRDPSDFLTTLQADLNHDTTGRLNEISAPTLIIGGSEDPFFSESILRETAGKIPDATLHVYDGVGHGVPKERKRRYENDTLAFIDDHLEGSFGRVGQTISSPAKEMKILLFLFALLVTAVVLLSSCGTQRGGTQQVGEMQRESRSIQAQDAQAVRSKLQMGAGELNITGGADQLMEGEFSYNVSNWKPKVSYDVSGERGALTVKQGSGGGVRLGGDARNEWDISLNDEVPTDLVVEMGAGESDLDLDSLTLTGLDLQMGAGKTTVDLTGDYAQDFDASIEGGVGQATVLLPSEVGVKAKAEGGLGKINAEGLKREGDSYVNDAYGNSGVTLSVDVQGGVGQINLEVV